MATTDAARLKVAVDPRDHVQGPDDAAVTLVEYGNYECRHCRHVVPIIDELREQFGERLRYVYRHFPLDQVHPHARLAAEAAEAADAQGKFWEMHDLLFRHQVELDREHLLEYAAELELDVGQFRQELDEGVHSVRVQRDVESAVSSGARGTPTFYLNQVRYDGPWDLASLAAQIEKPLGVRVRLMFQQFTSIQASSGILLLLATVLALVWANSAWGQSYFEVWGTHLTVSLGDRALSENLLHWVNDGLMVIFFFLVGLEIKREVLVGELASLRRAALPLMAAVGGMVVPAAIYAALNRGGEGGSGWGIPMATDIAFLLGMLTVLGKRVPTSLKVFFTALAIADDLGAVLVIAIFYSGEIAWVALGAGAVLLTILAVLNRGRVRSPLPYALLGIGLWLAFLQSGIHPTIAGVLLAMTIPARNPQAPAAYGAQCTAALGQIGNDETAGEESGRQQAAAQTLETLAERMQSPLRRLERLLNPWVAYLVVPIFAFANAGVDLGGALGTMLTSRVALGIAGGLVLGKPIGVTLFSWLAVKLRFADLPDGVSWTQLFSASWLAGIGFTMSLFIASSAFERPALLDTAKAAILVASLAASVVGVGLLTLTSAGKVLRSRVGDPCQQPGFRV
ncbi:MAG: Na+/H+ antiporter NhaA [Anaerolineae bacterium]|nr:Na+/H+ antiporter NhaA [Anaerolineae bacterium]